MELQLEFTFALPSLEFAIVLPSVLGSFQVSNLAASLENFLQQHFPTIVKLLPFFNKNVDFENLIDQSNAVINDRASRKIHKNDFAQMIINKKLDIKNKPDTVLNDEIINAQVFCNLLLIQCLNFFLVSNGLTNFQKMVKNITVFSIFSLFFQLFSLIFFNFFHYFSDL